MGVRVLLLILASGLLGCHLIYPFDTTAADGGQTGDLQQTDLQETDLPQVKPPPDLSTIEVRTDPDGPQPTCVAQTLHADIVNGKSGWAAVGDMVIDTGGITFTANLESSALLHPTPISLAAGCRVQAKISGSFAQGELIVMLYPNSCYTNCDVSGGTPLSCSLKVEMPGSSYACSTKPSIKTQTFRTIRVRRPAGAKVGSAMFSFLWLNTL